MRFREVFRYELECLLRSLSTWIYIAFLLGLPFLLSAGGGPGTVGVHRNAPVQVATLALALSMVFGLPVSAAIFGDAAVRDVQAAMDPLLYTSPLRKVEYLGGRFLAALAINAVVLLAIPVGLALGFDAVPALRGYSDPATSGPFRIGAYLQPYLLILLPNAVLAGALLFTTGMLARQVVPVYLAGVGLVISNMIAIGAAGDTLPAVLGPIGFHALIEVTKYWTAAERNTQLIGFPATLMWNRLLWLAVSTIVLALLHHKFRFAHDGGPSTRFSRSGQAPSTRFHLRAARYGGQVARAWPGARWKRRRAPAAEESERVRPVEVPRVAGSFGFRTTLRQTLAVTDRALAEVAASRWFVGALLFCAGFTLLTGWNVGDTVFDTSTWPVTFLVAETVIGTRIGPIPYMIIALYAGELVWKEREVGAAEIADATPVPEGVELLGRFLALVAMLVMIQAAFMSGGLLIQALQGYHHFEPGLYLRILFGLKLADQVLFAVLAMTIHVVVNHKYLGHFVVAMAFVGTKAAPMVGIVRHNLLLYAADPGWTYSDMNGFGPFIGPFVWFKLYWAAWALLLAVAAALFRVRGREPGLRHRLVLARVRFDRPVRGTAGVAIALILGLGGFIFYNTNILNAYGTGEDGSLPRLEYERRYKRFADIPQPTIASAELRIEIYPAEPAVDLRGTYRMVNRTGSAIDSVHVYLDPAIQASSLSFAPAATPVLSDEQVGYRIYSLEQALEPGASLALTFDVAFRPRGFPNSGSQTDVVSNGTYFNRSWMPFIGYQPVFEVTDVEARQRFGLEPQPPLPGPEDAAARQYRPGARDADLVHIEAIIGTAGDQIALTPGVLRRSWTEKDRRYFHYQTDVPTSLGATVFSAEYAVLEDRWNDVALQVFHHPTHQYNLDRTIRSMKASLEYFTREFGPYPDRQLRIVEIPRYGGFGRAHAHTIAFTEDHFLSRVKDGEIDQTFYGTAHEIAHQWWPRQAQGALVRGERFLSESLANYSAMMVAEKTYGSEVARRVYDYQMKRYLSGRATQSREVPLLDVEDQPYVAYRKGAIALYTLREQIGEDRVNAALRRYLGKFRDAGPPYPTSRDLYAELRAASPDSLHALLVDLFETITLWDVKTERATFERSATGEYRVTLDVVAKKMRADGAGHETEAPMDDLVEIGVFAPGDDRGEPLYLQRQRIRSGKQTIHFTVPREPSRAGIDPYRKLIERQRDDNVIAVTRLAATAGAR